MYRRNRGAPGSLSYTGRPSRVDRLWLAFCVVSFVSPQRNWDYLPGLLSFEYIYISSQTSPPLQGHIAVYRPRYDDTIKVKIRSFSRAMEVFVRCLPTHGTIHTVHTTDAAALKTTTHPKTRCSKPYAATQHLMLLMVGVCSRNMSS